MSTVTPAELAGRVRGKHFARLDAATAQRFLEEWRDRGIACEVLPGRWALTESGRAMFCGWAAEVELVQVTGGRNLKSPTSPASDSGVPLRGKPS